MLSVEAAHIGHVWRHILAKTHPPAEHEYRLLVAEALAGRVIAGVVDGEVAVLGGVFAPDAHLPGTAWLSVLPGMPARQFRSVFVAMRGVIATVGGMHGPGVVCVIADDNARGARLGGLLGFVPTAIVKGPLREWRLESGRRRRNDHGQGGAQAALAGGVCAERAGQPAVR